MKIINPCPKCGKPMRYDIELDYGEHSPSYCAACGYAERCSNWYSDSCKQCTEWSHCKKWEDIKNGDTENFIPRCRLCGRKCTEIESYVSSAKEENETPEQYAHSDGTYDCMSNTFVCDSCYIN